ncbi:hypothetical protein OSB04_027469 [Centaurea solstitialis]|uniref:Isopenicillin N synthase-like Fe(2+) 2OG dioxygenase domain-containing protein n=1 Tax=Centaurea solstitialis TaxID=347529 RepID=A0AA38SLB3_9ASTR|nr:hypothetical protein OSB04_027469 [Centaurea solstitialis]
MSRGEAMSYSPKDSYNEVVRPLPWSDDIPLAVGMSPRLTTRLSGHGSTRMKWLDMTSRPPTLSSWRMVRNPVSVCSWTPRGPKSVIYGLVRNIRFGFVYPPSSFKISSYTKWPPATRFRPSLNTDVRYEVVVRSLFDFPTEIKCRNLDFIVRSGYITPMAINPLYMSFGLYGMASRSDIETFVLNWRPHLIKGILSLNISGSLINIINKYHFNPQSVVSSSVPHTDSGFLTILQDNEEVGGLEVMDRSGHFVCVDGAFNQLPIHIIKSPIYSIRWPGHSID